ncbi:hypothetical protein GCM10027414_27390 [Humibacter ginsengiterrae]
MTDEEHAPVEGLEVFVIAYDEDGHELRLTLSEAAEATDRSRSLGIGDAGEIVRVDHGPFAAAADELRGANAASLVAAIEGNYLGTQLYVDLSRPPVNEDVLRLDERYHLDVRDGRLVAIVTDRHATQPDSTPEEIAASLARIADAYNCEIVDVTFTLVGGGTPEELLNDFSGIGLEPEHVAQLHADERANLASMAHDVRIALTVDPTRPVAALMDGAAALADYLTATREGPLDAAAVLNLLRGGHFRTLLGETESDFLEVKAAPHAIWVSRSAGDRAKIELAQDVARFANGDTDAVLIVGYGEATVEGTKQIARLTPVANARLDPVRVNEVLDARIVPPVDGLAIETFAVNDRQSVMAIYVPRQPPEMQPYLVHGAIAGDKVEGGFFSIVRRRGEGSIVTTAHQIHAYIVAGKRHLRGDE